MKNEMRKITKYETWKIKIKKKQKTEQEIMKNNFRKTWKRGK